MFNTCFQPQITLSAYILWQLWFPTTLASVATVAPSICPGKSITMDTDEKNATILCIRFVKGCLQHFTLFRLPLNSSLNTIYQLIPLCFCLSVFSSFLGHITRHSLLLVHHLFSQNPLSRQTVTTIVL